MARSDTAPHPAELRHLRARDSAGLRIVGIASAGTLLALLLSFSGGWVMWITGQGLLALLLVQWFAILHECGHDTLFRTRRWHATAGRIAGAFSLIPYASWTRVHARHHKWTGWQDLDPTTEPLVPRPLGRAERALVNVCWRLWVPLFSVMYRATNYWNVPRLLRMFPAAGDRRAILRDVALLLAVYAACLAALDAAVLLRACGLALLLSLVVEDLLLLSQHTHVPQRLSRGAAVRPFPSIEQETFTRSLRLPSSASALLLHVDAHELHHMYPFVPGYHLRRIPYSPAHEVGWWQWVWRARRVPGDVLLFQSRLESGWEI